MAVAVDRLVDEGGPLSLRDRLRQRDALLASTGCYQGLETLACKDADPLKYERFHSRLLVALMAARNVSKFVAASPGAREMGELIFALLTPEGDPVALSMGLIGHVATMPISVRWMIEHDYERNPAIREGDIFSADDPKTSGSPHPGDYFTFLPLFHAGRLVGWAAGMNHIIEVGALVAGSWPPYSPEIFTDGYIIVPTKTGENFEYHTGYLEMWKRKTRAAQFNILDDKMRLSGCMMIREKVLGIIAEYGLDYYLEATREVIEEERLLTKANIRSLTVPGRYRTAQFRPQTYADIGILFPFAARDTLVHAPLEMRIGAAGSVDLDLEGLSPWGFFGINGFEGALGCALFLGVSSHFAHNAKLNAGVTMAFDIHVPLGTVLNPDYEFASCSNPWILTTPTVAMMMNADSQAFFARGYLEECMANDHIWEGNQGGGILPDGTAWGFTNLEFLGAAANGGRPGQDGQSTAWAIQTAMPDIGNAEEWEYITPPLFYLGRKLLPDYCGHGKYRGGIGNTSTFLALNPGVFSMTRSTASIAMTTHCGVGMFGGYPAPGTFNISAHGTDMRARMAASAPYPRDPVELRDFVADGRLKAERVAVCRRDTAPIEMADGDLYSVASSAGGGWGDPIERDPRLVQQDLDQGVVTPQVARVVYAVVATRDAGSGAWHVDAAATAAARAEVRRERLGAMPVRAWWHAERERLRRGDLIAPVRDMHRDCMRFDKYRAELTGFWQLGADAFGAAPGGAGASLEGEGG